MLLWESPHTDENQQHAVAKRTEFCNKQLQFVDTFLCTSRTQGEPNESNISWSAQQKRLINPTETIVFNKKKRRLIQRQLEPGDSTQKVTFKFRPQQFGRVLDNSCREDMPV